jgi:DNA-binding Lrp family transcriptional regulator
MSGAADYQLRVAASDLDHYDRIHRDCLARLPGVSSMRTSFALRRIKRFEGYSVP